MTDVAINLRKFKWCALTQVTLIDQSNGTRADLDLVGGGGGCSCMLLVQPTPTCTDAGPDLLQLALVVPFHILYPCMYIVSFISMLH